MNIFFISDLHLFHENMLRGGKIAIRPFDTIHEMHERIVDGWNSVVKPGDKVYMQGDLTLMRPKTKLAGVTDFFSFEPFKAPGQWLALCGVVNQLQGEKRILLGNHDHMTAEMYHALGFEKVLAYREMAGILFSHIPVHTSQFYRFRGNVHGHTHEAKVMRVPSWGPDPKPGDWNVLPDPRYINVCAEPRNYVPMSLDEIVAHYDKLEKW